MFFIIFMVLNLTFIPHTAFSYSISSGICQTDEECLPKPHENPIDSDWFCRICSFLPICGCITSPYAESIVYPDKDLTEIVIHGHYYPQDKTKLEELIKEVIENEGCATDHSCPRNPHDLPEGERLEEALDRRFQYVERELFHYSESLYCYNETENKEYHINENLKSRLYNYEGELLTESFLRLKKRTNENSYLAKTYLPYHEAGDKIVFVNLQGNKENVFFETKMMTQDFLQAKSTTLEIFRDHVWFFHNECHSSPNFF